VAPTEAQAARFLAQAAMGTSRAEIASVVSLGYEPKLTMAWFDCMGTFGQEASLDRVFAGSLFWVVTRTNECFY